jgi:threonine/homoserine/homoserine lactone efflux protein
MIYTRKFRFSVLAIVSFGVYLAWEGIKMFREEKRRLH